jgi:hypothetical protein
LITFDELKLNYKTLLWNVKQILQNDNWKQFLVCGNKYNPKKSHIHRKDGFSFKAQPKQESKYNNYWRAPKSRGETKLKVSQSQVAESRLGSTLPTSNSRKG